MANSTTQLTSDDIAGLNQVATSAGGTLANTASTQSGSTTELDTDEIQGLQSLAKSAGGTVANAPSVPAQDSSGETASSLSPVVGYIQQHAGEKAAPGLTCGTGIEHILGLPINNGAIQQARTSSAIATVKPGQPFLPDPSTAPEGTGVWFGGSSPSNNHYGILHYGADGKPYLAEVRNDGPGSSYHYDTSRPFDYVRNESTHRGYPVVLFHLPAPGKAPAYGQGQSSSSGPLTPDEISGLQGIAKAAGGTVASTGETSQAQQPGSALPSVRDMVREDIANASGGSQPTATGFIAEDLNNTADTAAADFLHKLNTKGVGTREVDRSMGAVDETGAGKFGPDGKQLQMTVKDWERVDPHSLLPKDAKAIPVVGMPGYTQYTFVDGSHVVIGPSNHYDDRGKFAVYPSILAATHGAAAVGSSAHPYVAGPNGMPVSPAYAGNGQNYQPTAADQIANMTGPEFYAGLIPVGTQGAQDFIKSSAKKIGFSDNVAEDIAGAVGVTLGANKFALGTQAAANIALRLSQTGGQQGKPTFFDYAKSAGAGVVDTAHGLVSGPDAQHLLRALSLLAEDDPNTSQQFWNETADLGHDAVTHPLSTATLAFLGKGDEGVLQARVGSLQALENGWRQAARGAQLVGDDAGVDAALAKAEQFATARQFVVENAERIKNGALTLDPRSWLKQIQSLPADAREGILNARTVLDQAGRPIVDALQEASPVTLAQRGRALLPFEPETETFLGKTLGSGPEEITRQAESVRPAAAPLTSDEIAGVKAAADSQAPATPSTPAAPADLPGSRRSRSAPTVSMAEMNATLDQAGTKTVEASQPGTSPIGVKQVLDVLQPGNEEISPAARVTTPDALADAHGAGVGDAIDALRQAEASGNVRRLPGHQFELVENPPNAPLMIDGKLPWQMTQSDFVEHAPKDDGVMPPPSIEKMVKAPFLNEIGHGAPGVSVEPTNIEGVTHVVYRNQEGRPIGVLRVTHDDAGNVDVQNIAVDTAYRRQGIGTALYRAAENAGLKVEDAAGHQGLTLDGAKFFHGRSVAQAVAKGLPVPHKVLSDYPDLFPSVEGATKATRPSRARLAERMKDAFEDEGGEFSSSPKTNGTSDTLQAAENQAGARIQRALAGKVNSGVDPTVVKDLAIWAGAKLARGVIDGTRFAATALREFGAKVQPHLSAAWQLAKQIASDLVAEEGGWLNIAPIAQKLHDATAGFRNGRYRGTAVIDKGTADAIWRKASAWEAGKTMAHIWGGRVLEGLSDAQRDLFERYWHDQWARDFEQNNEPYNTTALKKLTPAETAEVQSDPLIQRALARHDAIQAHLWAMRKFIDPSIKQRSLPDGHFMSLHALKDAGGKDVSQQMGPGRSVAAMQRTRGTKHAEHATGTGQEYSRDYIANLASDIGSDYDNARLKELYRQLLTTRDAQGNPLAVTNSLNKPIPDTMTYNGVQYPVKTIETDLVRGKAGTGSYVVKIGVPEPVWKDVADVTVKLGENESADGFLRRAQGIVTGLNLASPREAVGHANRLLGLVSRIPPTSKAARIIEPLIPHLGPRIGALVRMWNLDFNDPAVQERYIRMVQAGGGSTRPFSHEMEGNVVNKIPVIGPKLIKPHIDAAHGFLFSMPEGKAFSGDRPIVGKGGYTELLNRVGRVGFDIRLRTLAEATREAFEGNADPQRVREFANQFGQYAAKQDQVIEKLKKIPLISPYVATSLPVQLTELRHLTGDIGLKGLPPAAHAAVRAEVAARGVFGTVLFAMALNKLLSGHYPWQNPQGHETDIQIGTDSDGAPVYLSATTTAPELYRPARNLGIKDALALWNQDNLDPGSYGLAEGRNLYNTAGQVLSSPLTSTVATATTGKSPFYMTQHGSFLRTSTPAPSAGGQVLNNVGAAIGEVNPALANVPGTPDYTGKFASPVWRAAKDVADVVLNNPLRRDDDESRRPHEATAASFLRAYGRWKARNSE